MGQCSFCGKEVDPIVLFRNEEGDPPWCLPCLIAYKGIIAPVPIEKMEDRQWAMEFEEWAENNKCFITFLFFVLKKHLSLSDAETVLNEMTSFQGIKKGSWENVYWNVAKSLVFRLFSGCTGE